MGDLQWGGHRRGMWEILATFSFSGKTHYVKHDKSSLISDTCWMRINQLVARNVARIRSERELSLGELARRAGVSKQTLSKIEQGQGNPTIGTLEEVARALNISMGRVLTEWGSRGLLQRYNAVEWEADPRGQLRELDQIYGSGYVRTQVLELDLVLAEASTAVLSTGALHQVYVMEGAVEIRYGQETVLLGQGDFLRFPGDVEHAFGSPDKRALIHLTTTAPHVAQFGPSR